MDSLIGGIADLTTYFKPITVKTNTTQQKLFDRVIENFNIKTHDSESRGQEEPATTE